MFSLFITWNGGKQDCISHPDFSLVSLLRSLLRFTHAKVRIWDCRNRRFVK